jgi:hypothetical protein
MNSAAWSREETGASGLGTRVAAATSGLMLRVKVPLFRHHRPGQMQQLARGGTPRHFRGFARSAQPSVKGLDHRIVLRGAQTARYSPLHSRR